MTGLNVKVNEIEKRIAVYAGKKYSLLVSRAATGLYLSYQAAKVFAGKEVIKPRIVLPATLCHSPANVALYAGYEIIFCDVNEADFTIDARCLENIFEEVEGIIAVVAVHTFGHAADMESISKICKKNGVLLIDDAAQAFGGYYNSIPLGAWGDIGILSFGHSKIIDVGWGGAIVTDNEDLYNSISENYAMLDERDAESSILRQVYSETYYSIERLTRKSQKLNKLFWTFPEIFKSLYVYREEPTEAVLNVLCGELDNLHQNIERRKVFYDIYIKQLQHVSGIVLPTLRQGSIPWRMVFRVSEEIHLRLITELRSLGIDVSSWYPSLTLRFKTHEFSPAKISERLNNTIVNLWLDPNKIDENQIIANCKELIDIVEANNLTLVQSDKLKLSK